jgi:hypothetical protein
MQEITKTAYTIRELSEEARETALENHHDFNTSDEFWYEHHIQELFPEQAAAKGFELREYPVQLMSGARRYEPRIYFSGFASQGDGASFEATVHYEEFILKNKLGNRYRTLLNHAREWGGGVLIRKSGRYEHSGTMHIDDYDRHYSGDAVTTREIESAERAERQAEELADEILDAARDLADDFYRQLEKEYEYQSSEEQLIEALEVNEMLFNEDGTDF